MIFKKYFMFKSLISILVQIGFVKSPQMFIIFYLS